MHHITDTLLVGNIHDARRPPVPIGGLLWAAAEHQVEAPSGIPFKWIPLEEFAEPDPVELEEGVAWMESHLSARPLLVCCRAGLGRSVSIAITYLCAAQGMSYHDAVALVTARRPGASPLPNLAQAIRVVQAMRHRSGESAGPRPVEL